MKYIFALFILILAAKAAEELGNEVQLTEREQKILYRQAFDVETAKAMLQSRQAVLDRTMLEYESKCKAKLVLDADGYMNCPKIAKKNIK